MLLDAKDRTEMNAPLAKGESRGFGDEAAPPSYDDVAEGAPPPPIASGSGSTASSTPGAPAAVSPLSAAPRSSHVSVFSKNSSVAASHVLDLSRAVPPSTLRPESDAHAGEFDKEGRRANGFWGSANGGVKVDVGVRGFELGDGGDSKLEKRVRISCRSQNGGVRCSVVERSPPSTPFTVSAFSQNGPVHLVLPSSFRGPLHLSTKNGKVNLSPRVKAAFTPVKDGEGFVGDLEGWEGTEEDAEDKGWDVGRAESKNGSVNVKFYEEVEEERSKPGWFSSLFSSR